MVVGASSLFCDIAHALSLEGCRFHAQRRLPSLGRTMAEAAGSVRSRAMVRAMVLGRLPWRKDVWRNLSERAGNHCSDETFPGGFAETIGPTARFLKRARQDSNL